MNTSNNVTEQAAFAAASVNAAPAANPGWQIARPNAPWTLPGIHAVPELGIYEQQALRVSEV